jgi:hypothetical protein
MAGLFFCLASDTVQGFYFAKLQYSHIQAFTAAFLPSMQIYTTTTPKAFTGLYSGVPVDLTYSNERNTAATQAAYTNLHPAGWHTVKRCTCTDTRYYRHTGSCTGQRSLPIIIRYIRVRPVIDPCPAVQHSADHANPSGSASPPVQGQPGGCLDSSHAERLAIWHRVCLAHSTRRAVQRQGARRAEPLTATAASLFGLSPDS